MKKINEVFKGLKKEWAATAVTVFPATEEGWKEAHELATKLRKDPRKKVCDSMCMSDNGGFIVKVTVYEKKRLAH